MTIDRTSKLVDVAFAVCTALSGHGTIAVLVGGSAATYYAAGLYQSHDADLVITVDGEWGAAKQSIIDLGFRPKNGMLTHPKSVFTLDFLPGPLAVGGELIKRYNTVYRSDEFLYIITRTDSVRDRLAAYYHWNDHSSLSVAIAIATGGEIDMDAIEAWSRREGRPDRYREFHNQVRDAAREREAE